MLNENKKINFNYIAIPALSRDFFIMGQTVAIQGIKGSFHHQVAANYFGVECDIQECSSFTHVVRNLIEGKAEVGIMAIENSIAGSIISNYALIDKYNLVIRGEYYLDVKLDLLTHGSAPIEELLEVHSHPMALLQCSEFLMQYPHIKLVEAPDTAAAAQKIATVKDAKIAAIAGPIAGDMYGLTVAKQDIHTMKRNKTRFVVLDKKPLTFEGEGINKVSLKFELDDVPGSLATVLNVINNCQLNMTKIQSMPIIETPFQYSFFVDVVFEDAAHYLKAEKLLKIMTKSYKVLGVYCQGN